MRKEITTMRKRPIIKGTVMLVALLAVLALSLTVGPAVAEGPTGKDIPTSDRAVVALGKAFDVNGREVEGYAIIDYEKGKARPPGRGKAGKCYAFLGKGARWRTTEAYVVDPTNTRGLDETTVRDLTGTSLGEWDSEVGFDIFGPEMGGVVDGIDLVSPDGKNEVMFGDWPDPDAEVIAVAVVWGIFSVPPPVRELVEWDVLFDEVDFDWSAEESGVAGKMDFQNIATHEFGHGAGMDHPGDGCTEETMYDSADYAETKKRDLHTGDIAGINRLY